MTSNGAMRSGIRDTWIVFATKLMGVVAGIVTQACLAWLLAPEGRGEFAVCTMFALILGVIFGLGFDRAVQYQLIKGVLSRSEAIGIAIVFALANSVLAAGAGWLLAEWPIAFFEKASVESFRISLLLIPVIALSTALALLLEGEKLFRAGAIVAVSSALANVALVIAFVGYLEMGVKGAVLAWVIASIAGIWLQLTYLQVGPRLPRFPVLGSIMSYATRYYAARLGNVVNAEIGLIVLALLATKSEIGFYAAASTLTNKLTLLPQSLATVLLPRVGQSSDGMPELIARSCRFTSLFLAAALIVIVVAAPAIVPLMFSTAFEPAVALIWTLSVGAWARGVGLPVSTYFLGVNRPGMVSTFTALELVLGALVMAIGYDIVGLIGAAVGASIASVIANVARVSAFHRMSGTDGLRVWVPRSTDVRYIIDVIDRLMGVPQPTRSLGSTLLAQDLLRGYERHTIISNDRVVKRQSPDRVHIEQLKTSRGSEIGLQTGLFNVPQLLVEESDARTLVFRRVANVATLWQHLVAGGSRSDSEKIIRAAAKALASIHARLELPTDVRLKIHGVWTLGSDSPPVVLHGDFTVFNLLISNEDRTLWVTDWATSDALESQANVGPPELDVTWFVASLYFESYLGLKYISNRGALAKQFLEEYAQSGGIHVSRLAQSMHALCARLEERRPSAYERIRKCRHELLASGPLAEFALKYSKIAGIS